MPTEYGFNLETRAQSVVGTHLGVRVEHTGEDSDKPDLCVYTNSGTYEIDVTLEIEQWRMDQLGALFKDGGFELLEVEAMPVSLWVQLGANTRIKELNVLAVELAKLVVTSGVDWVHRSDYFRVDANADVWGISQSHHQLLSMCRDLDLVSLHRAQGKGQLVRIMTGFGGSWDGTANGFNEWLTSYLYSESIQSKIKRSLKLATGPLGLFVWLDGTVSIPAHEWVDRGTGVPATIDLDQFGIVELWVASRHEPNSFVYFREGEWVANRSNDKQGPWFAQNYGAET